MTYNPSNQYRCDIVRSRTIKLADDLIPAYANIIDGLCPCSEADFIDGFNNQLKAYLCKSGSALDIKALNNHRTETAKTLLGMYYIDQFGTVHVSERTRRYLLDGDQPAFFKDICYKLQFPNGMTKSRTVKTRVLDGLKLYPCRFLIEAMQVADKKGILLTEQEVGYYILNSKDVLVGKSKPAEVVNYIIRERTKGIVRKLPSGSYNWQHITGIITYLEYANLVIETKGKTRELTTLRLNNLETAAINIFVSNRNARLKFNVTKYIIGTGISAKVAKDFQANWDQYNSEISDQYVNFYTSPSSLGISITKIPTKPTTNYTAAIGAAGEKYVFDYEVNRVSGVNPGFAVYVKNRSDERKIGFDIESVSAVGANPLEPMYIEVKTTSRVTVPTAISSLDMVNMTYYEWKAACDNPDQFYLYRVYLVKGKVLLYIIGKVHSKSTSKLIDVTAPSYLVKFDVADAAVIDRKEQIV